MPNLTATLTEPTKLALREAAAYVAERATEEAATALLRGATPEQAASTFESYVRVAGAAIRDDLIARLYGADPSHAVRAAELADDAHLESAYDDLHEL